MLRDIIKHCDFPALCHVQGPLEFRTASPGVGKMAAGGKCGGRFHF